MCGRFTLTADPADLQQAFPAYAFPMQYTPRFNIAPTQPVLAIHRQGVEFFLWGLIPSWAKDASIGARLINARAETLAEKPAFRAAFKYRRCLIPADGFYEWKSEAGTKRKTPYFISLRGHRLFAFARLWEIWNSPDGSEICTCAIVTTRPNHLMAELHDRMPVILQPSDYAQWLDPAPLLPASLLPLLRPFPAEEMTAYPVSTLVNNPANDRPECIQPT